MGASLSSPSAANHPPIEQDPSDSEPEAGAVDQRPVVAVEANHGSLTDTLTRRSSRKRQQTDRLSPTLITPQKRAKGEGDGGGGSSLHDPSNVWDGYFESLKQYKEAPVTAGCIPRM